LIDLIVLSASLLKSELGPEALTSEREPSLSTTKVTVVFNVPSPSTEELSKLLVNKFLNFSIPPANVAASWSTRSTISLPTGLGASTFLPAPVLAGGGGGVYLAIFHLPGSLYQL
jgi:hypothetical protein